MYIKGIDKRLLKDFKESYLIELSKLYADKKILTKFEEDLKEIKEKLNLQRILNLNIYYWIIRGWTKEEAKEKIEIIKKKRKKPKYTCLQKNFWVEKGFTEEEAISRIKFIQQKNNKAFNTKRREHPENYNQSSPMTIEFWVNKGLNEMDAKNKIKSQRKLNREYWIKWGFTEEEAIKKVTEFQIDNSEKLFKKKKENPEKYKASYTTNLEYYIKQGFSIEESKILLKDRQTTFSLEKCIKRHGQEEGLKKWKERQEKWKNKVFNNEKCISLGFSVLSKTIINEIIKIDKSIMLFGKNEKFLYDNDFKRSYKYDLVKPENKKIIEINGIFWHCKPGIYNESYFHKIRKMSAKDIWNTDKRKIEVAEQNGYKILIVWEDDYYNDPEKIIKECVNFLNT